MRNVRPSPPDPVAHPIMFYGLTGLALAVFAPCVLVPIWIEAEEVRAHERAAERITGELEARRDYNAARIDALLADPLVSERIVRRELNYRGQNEFVVHLAADELAAIQVEPALTPPPPPAEPPPPWLAGLTRWMPAWPWRELFARPANRTLLMLMSGGLLFSAFMLYGRGASPRLSPDSTDGL